MSELQADGPVERHLDLLFDKLSGTGRAGRRTLSEAEDHLRSAVAESLAGGASALDAERAAVARFGAVEPVARGIRLAHGAVLRPLFTGAWLVGTLALLAMGVSGLISEVTGHLFGAGFVAGDASGVTYTPARCDDYFEYFPDAGSCAKAAALHHWGEIVDGRFAAGLLGLLSLAVYLLARRYTRLRDARWTPPAGGVALVAVALFAVVGVAFTGMNALQLAFGEHSGVGVGLADGVVSLVVAVLVAVLAWRRLRLRLA
jgi:hypothetical protein